jgi:hypothetical protein
MTKLVAGLKYLEIQVKAGLKLPTELIDLIIIFRLIRVITQTVQITILTKTGKGLTKIKLQKKTRKIYSFILKVRAELHLIGQIMSHPF